MLDGVTRIGNIGAGKGPASVMLDGVTRIGNIGAGKGPASVMHDGVTHDDHPTSKETLISSCSLDSDIFHKEPDNKMDDNNEIVTLKPKGILSHKDAKKVENLKAGALHQDPGAANQSASIDQGDMLTGSAALDYYEILCKAREEAIESERERGLLESLKKKEELLDAVMESAMDSKKATNQSKSWFQGFKSLWRKSQYNAIKPHPTLSSHIRMQIEGKR
ncbi:uncharacterized protein [Amphiura filiformis]|uniref:uncharacterized protein n=1 Tax=Amphiura filiformis TaxID=82378 RepID=UPI003B21D88A